MTNTDFARLPIDAFLAALASEAPTPGGGTAAAVSGAMGAALTEMVAALTLGKEKFADAHAAVRPIAKAATAARRELLGLARGCAGVRCGRAARRLPKDTDERRLPENGRRFVEPGRDGGAHADGPTSARLLAALPELSLGNPNAASDAGTAALGWRPPSRSSLERRINPAASKFAFAAAMHETLCRATCSAPATKCSKLSAEIPQESGLTKNARHADFLTGPCPFVSLRLISRDATGSRDPWATLPHNPSPRST
jgi:hypothetical protein